MADLIGQVRECEAGNTMVVYAVSQSRWLRNLRTTITDNDLNLLRQLPD